MNNDPAIYLLRRGGQKIPIRLGTEIWGPRGFLTIQPEDAPKILLSSPSTAQLAQVLRQAADELESQANQQTGGLK